MIHDKDGLGKSGLAYFAEMTASITHELKNALAVINESAGLIGDFAMMAERGGSIPAQRLFSISEQMKKQISRADALTKKINRFAHSLDDSEAHIDLFETVAWVLELASRIIENRMITLDTRFPAEPVMIRTQRFLLMNVIWGCLRFAMECKGVREKMCLSHQCDETHEKICFHGLRTLGTNNDAIFPSGNDIFLFQALGARCEQDPVGGTLTLLLPKKK